MFTFIPPFFISLRAFFHLWLACRLLTYQANLWLCIIQLVQHISLKIEGFLGIFSRRKVAKSAGYFNIFYKLSPFTYFFVAC